MTGSAEMIALSLGIFGASKFAVLLADRGHLSGASPARALAWLATWPGMDARAMLAPAARPDAGPRRPAWLAGVATTAAGLVTLTVLAPRLAPAHPMLGGWLAIVGALLALHFGAFQLAALAWRRAGCAPAGEVMNAPWLATSLADFWSRRWNVAFHELARRFVFEPLRRRAGVRPALALLAAFLASGLVHDLVISLPAREGYGLPTLYFLLQALAVLAERSRPGRALGLGGANVARSRAFAIAVAVLPAPLVFHPAFIRRVVLPMLGVPSLDGGSLMTLPSPHATLDLALWLTSLAHFCVLIAGAQVPWRLRWREELARLSPFNRKIVWVYHGFMGLIIISFGVLTAVLHDDMLAGDRGAVALAALIGTFWGARLVVDALVYKHSDWPAGAAFRVGHALLVFAFVGIAATCISVVTLAATG